MSGTVQSTLKSARRFRIIQNKDPQDQLIPDFQALVLTALLVVPSPATLDDVLLWIEKETGEIPDVAQTYAATNALLSCGFVEKRGKSVPQKGRRSMLLFAPTKAGKAAHSRKLVALRKLLTTVTRP